MKFINFCLFLILIVAIFGSADKVYAANATLYFNQASTSVNTGDIFSINLLANTGGSNVVVVNSKINYDKNIVNLVSWDTSGSVFAAGNNCINNNKFCNIETHDSVNGIINIVGVKPSPGINTSSGLVAKLSFKAVNTTSNNTNAIKIQFIAPGNYTDSDVIIDDGLGTDILTSVSPINLSVSSPVVVSSPIGGSNTPPVVNSPAPITTGGSGGGSGGSGGSSVPINTVSSGALNIPAPTNLKADAVSATQINLSWDKPANYSVSGYYIYRNNAQISTEFENSYKDINLTPATAYTYKIVAYNSSGATSTSSNIAQISTPAQNYNVVGKNSDNQPQLYNSNQQQPTVDLPTSLTERHLAVGSKGADVKNVQQFLKAQNFYNGDINGVYDKKTAQAVGEFQEQKNIARKGQSGYGEIGKKTRQSMNSYLSNSSNKDNLKGSLVASAGQNNQMSSFGSYITKKHLKLGSRGNDVKRVQQFLASEKIYFGKISGIYDEITLKAVRKFQLDNNIAKEDDQGYGEIGKKTRQEMNNHLIAGSSSSVQNTDQTQAMIADLKEKIQKLQKLVEEYNKINR